MSSELFLQIKNLVSETNLFKIGSSILPSCLWPSAWPGGAATFPSSWGSFFSLSGNPPLCATTSLHKFEPSRKITGTKFSSASTRSWTQVSWSPRTIVIILQENGLPCFDLPLAIHFASSYLSLDSSPHLNFLEEASSPIKKKWVWPFVSSFSLRFVGLILG